MAIDPDAVDMFQPQIDALNKRLDSAPALDEAILAQLAIAAAWERLEAAIYRQIDPFEGKERADALNGLAALVEQA